MGGRDPLLVPPSGDLRTPPPGNGEREGWKSRHFSCLPLCAHAGHKALRHQMGPSPGEGGDEALPSGGASQHGGQRRRQGPTLG